MSERMRTIGFSDLLNWIFSEYSKEDSIFGIPSSDFYLLKSNSSFQVFGEQLDFPIGPAAGPHTQLSQNIISAYLAGGRFFELKTVQVLDELKIDKPCIDAQDECYNVEWSQELKLEESLDEYIKAWMILHLLKGIFYPNSLSHRGFIFNMSIGYNLKGIKSERMQKFIDSMIDVSRTSEFDKYKEVLTKFIKADKFSSLLKSKLLDKNLHTRLVETIENISPKICNSVTLSTMHGCPPEEIEAIAKYLLKEKNLHTHIKLNPTLLGYENVREILETLGYNKVELNEQSFVNDLKFDNAVGMIERLQEFSNNVNRNFGVKLSNTLPVKNKRNVLVGEEMYMSGRSLFPITINVALRLATAFNGNINISYSGGASVYNTSDILKCGIYPVTYATELLKPGGYRRLNQISQKISEDFNGKYEHQKINLELLNNLAEDSLKDSHYKKETRQVESIKVPTKLGPFDCFVAPCNVACPIHQNIPAYVKLVEEGRYNEAFDVIVSKNALPNITAHICDHQCQFHCTRWDYDEPVLIRDLKKTAVENASEKFIDEVIRKGIAQPNNIKCAVIGAGPSGLAVSYFLARAGFDVTVFEKHDKAGGIVQNILPDFRLPQSAIDKDVEYIKRHGVKFQFNADPNFSIEELKQQGFKYIYLAIGAGKSNILHLKGNYKNLINALDFLWKYHHDDKMNLGKSVAVVGGGNSAMDAARAATRIDGVDKVYIVYRRTKEFMPADKEEFDNAIDDGVIFNELLVPIEFDNKNLRCQKMELGEVGIDGRREVIPLENQFENFEIDFVISAIGEKVDFEILGKNQISINKFGKVEVNSATNETLLENVFIGGDTLRGPSTVVESIADGKKAAEAIIKKEMLNITFDKNYGYLFNPDERKRRITEIKGKVFTDNISTSDTRCLECVFICNECVDVCPNRANIPINIDSSEFKNVNQILHIDWMCNKCGNCETFCPHQGSPYKDKITLFKNKDDFNSSHNDGFYAVRKNDYFEIVSRTNSNHNKFRFSLNGQLLEGNAEFSQYIKLISIIISDYSYLLCSSEEETIA
jgi:putative selenate reductase